MRDIIQLKIYITVWSNLTYWFKCICSTSYLKLYSYYLWVLFIRKLVKYKVVLFASAFHKVKFYVKFKIVYTVIKIISGQQYESWISLKFQTIIFL